VTFSRMALELARITSVMGCLGLLVYKEREHCEFSPQVDGGFLFFIR